LDAVRRRPEDEANTFLIAYELWSTMPSVREVLADAQTGYSLSDLGARHFSPTSGALLASRARPLFRVRTADELDDRRACCADPAGLVLRSKRRSLEDLAAIRICSAFRGNCGQRDIPKDAASLGADRAGDPRSRRAGNDSNLSVPATGRPAPIGLEEPRGREGAVAFEASPTGTETGYSAP
jgi:hypothetical protein